MFSSKSDLTGILASSLCLVHCLATPFIFVAKACSETCSSDAPFWWQAIDYVFLAIAFIAIYNTTKNLEKSWMNLAFWGSWLTLGLLVLNESFEVLTLPQHSVYIPAAAIIILHFYNIKIRKCSNLNCC